MIPGAPPSRPGSFSGFSPRRARAVDVLSRMSDADVSDRPPNAWTYACEPNVGCGHGDEGASIQAARARRLPGSAPSFARGARALELAPRALGERIGYGFRHFSDVERAAEASACVRPWLDDRMPAAGLLVAAPAHRERAAVPVRATARRALLARHGIKAPAQQAFCGAIVSARSPTPASGQHDRA